MIRAKLLTSQLAALLAAGVALTVPAVAERLPRAVTADSRIRKVVYSPDDVVIIQATMGISSMIVFDPDETIQTIAAGDTVAWQITPNQAKNVVFVKPLERDATTNLNIISNKRIYTIALVSADEQNLKAAIYKVQFVYPDLDLDKRNLLAAEAATANPNLRDLDKRALNYSYGYKGADALRPLTVFDDGVKTYLQFAPLTGEIPAVFLVNTDRSETLVNFRREGDYIVIDKVARQFTLRKGDVTLCLYNLRRPMLPPAVGNGPAPARVAGGNWATDRVSAPLNLVPVR